MPRFASVDGGILFLAPFKHKSELESIYTSCTPLSSPPLEGLRGDSRIAGTAPSASEYTQVLRLVVADGMVAIQGHFKVMSFRDCGSATEFSTV